MVKYTYLFTILLFAGGANLLEYIFHRQLLAKYRKPILFLWLLFTAYALLIEYYALNNNWGEISRIMTTGIVVGVIPLEEVIFWALVNMAILNAVATFYTFEKEKTVWWKYIFKFFRIRIKD